MPAYFHGRSTEIAPPRESLPPRDDKYSVALFDWSDKYSVGVREMDAQHRKLIGLLNDLHRAMLAAEGREALEPILLSLTRYTAVHFAAEEKAMQAVGFPGYERHKQEHAKLAAEVSRFQRQYQAGNIALTVPLLQFLKTWLKGHILDSDAQYGPWME